MACSFRKPTVGDAYDVMQEVQAGVLSVAASLLTACSCLSKAEVRRRLVSASKEGLLTKAMMVRPYRELLAHFSDEDAFDLRRGQSLLDADLSAKFELLERKRS
ncbi:hypothetical protein, partial [Variovorax beijingensis]|uniref:hypothetical protein n=1 Tax=Variovorax beijingensis TaxID=2496117 RepID=UPI001CB99649